MKWYSVKAWMGTWGLLVLAMVVVLTGLGFLVSVAMKGCNQLEEEIMQRGLKNVLEDVWYGEGNDDTKENE